ncbi:HesB/IscA family protein [Nocardioides aequoreus]|uniref:HesB/IscA family protein n=1 Tax=Nocardioides aequoreus TaxID=397278 RepID=UPI0004C42035|nr:iron-sulfur cluster biosynthesis family protein [Nocardioides aequoreus]
MLTLTENASAIVKEIASQTEGEDTGLRIAVEPGPEAAFGITVTEQPEPGDQVVEQGGATVYLESNAAEVLDDKVLDAGVDTAGNVEFALAQQA